MGNAPSCTAHAPAAAAPAAVDGRILSAAGADSVSRKPFRIHVNGTQSVCFRDGSPPVRYDDGLYDQENRAPAVSIQRRSSAKAKKREEQARLEDRMRMPPPPRPHSTAPRQISTGPFVPPRGPGDNPFTPRTPTSAELEPFNYAQERARMRRPSVSSRRPMSYDHGATKPR
ncbi:hypothetical protein MCOR02_004151 [Pyricularia oryzae]|nr:hypothetical protein MCOR02_004151 [Pyricularia oryzae]